MKLLNRKSLILCISLMSVITAGSTTTNNSKNKVNAVLDNISDLKDFKKLIRSKNNVLGLFIENNFHKQVLKVLKTFKEAANLIRGTGTMLLVDCNHSDKKKLCKKLKAFPDPYVLKHYKDGDFHVDYSRQLTVSSMVNFMKDPTGDLPWDEDPMGANVIHFKSYEAFTRHLKKDTRPMLVMFYVPWCGFCKRLKPDYSKAATELKGKGCIIAAMDLEKQENSKARKEYNITGFPTILYFKDGKIVQSYEGQNNKEAIIAFMNDPTAIPEKKPKETDWSADTNSEIVHLTTRGFEAAMKEEPSVLVMFYAPWCGHCQRMKPVYERAALIMKEQGVNGILAALDATKEPLIAESFKVRGYPSFKYFVFSEYRYDINIREADKLVAFMKNPQEPPPPPPPVINWEMEDPNVQFLKDDNFVSVLRKNKHVLVMFYAPWCAHCKKAKPEFSSAAESLKAEKRVILAAVDCTKNVNVCQEENVSGYPTFRYYSNYKTRYDYPSGRNEKEFINFMKELLKRHEEL